MIHPPNPTFPYSGITIILDKPSRHDARQLISGYAGEYLLKALHPYLRQQFDIRTLDEKSSIRDDTKGILLLGPDAVQYVTSTSNTEHALLRYRGSPFFKNNICCVPTFAPQDAYDRRDYSEHDGDDENEDNEKESEKDFQKTRRVNWRFWMQNDTRKLIDIVRYGIKQREYPKVSYYPDYAVFREFANSTTERNVISIDIETNRHRQITCIGIGNNRQCYVIPFIRYDNSLAYDKLTIGKFLCTIAELFDKHTIVGHNISAFDLIVLAHHYGICFPGDVKDTMIMHHYAFLELEKSLGHCISLYLQEVYHKDEGNFNPHNREQESQLWEYNAKDVIRTLHIYQELLEYSNKAKGLKEAFDTGNRTIRVYSTATVQGARIDTDELKKQFDNANLRVELLRHVLKAITHRDINANSWQQVDHYLYDLLGYKRPPKKQVGEKLVGQATSKKQLYKLYAKYGIPSLRVILAIRVTRKKASDLQFTLWKKDRFTCTWKIAGPETHRLGSSKLFKFADCAGYGSNFQNWNKSRRKMLIAD